jgi:hypothetical protein
MPNVEGTGGGYLHVTGGDGILYYIGPCRPPCVHISKENLQSISDIQKVIKPHIDQLSEIFGKLGVHPPSLSFKAKDGTIVLSFREPTQS